MLYDAVVRSPVPHRTCLLRTDRAAHVSGAVAILTAADLGISTSCYGLRPAEPPLRRRQPGPLRGRAGGDVDYAPMSVKATNPPPARDAGMGVASDA